MAQETRDFTLVVDATSIHGCVYLDMDGIVRDVQELVEWARSTLNSERII